MNRTPPPDARDFTLQQFVDFATSTTNKLTEFSNNHDNIQQRIEDNVTRSMAATIEDIVTRSINGLKVELVAKIDNVEESLNDVEERLTEKIDNVEERLTEKIDNVEERLNDVEERLTEKIDHVEQRLNDKIDNVEQRLNDKIDNVEQHLTDKINDVEQRLNDKIDNVEERLADKIDDVETSVTARIDNVRIRVTERIDNVRSDLKKTIAACDLNARFRTQNTHYAANNGPIVPLVSILSGDAILGFPEDRQQFDNLEEGDIIRILTELGEPEAERGTLQAKRMRLEVLLGLTVVPRRRSDR